MHHHLPTRSSCRTVALAAILGVTGSLAAADPAPTIGALVDAYHDVGLFDGSVLVAERGEVIYEGGAGFANVEWEIPNDERTRFRIGSITKQFTAMLVMQLVEAGEIDLQASISTYLPDYRSDTGRVVTVHHLLTHTSGIPSYTRHPGLRGDADRDPWKPGPFVAEFCSGDLEFEPGSAFRYNNSGYFLLGLIIERVTGQTYASVLQEHILDPLGMADTGYDDHAEIIPRRAAGYERLLDGVSNATYLDMSVPYAAGSMYSTVGDLHRWDRALYTDALLPATARTRMFEPFLEDYAYGWRVHDVTLGEDARTTRVIEHGGGINGFNTLISRFVDEERLVVLLSNHGRAPLSDMTRQIIGVLDGDDYETPRPPLDRTLAQTAYTQGVDAAVAFFDAHREQITRPEQLEASLNASGYQLLNQGRHADAIAVFRLNTRLFPEAFNPWDSLGEALMIDGDHAAAIAHYEKSLALNPDNDNARVMLEKLREPAGVTTGR
ncbi:MAG: class A beta-lactamase-related serine hydrolase [Phycisphaerales bacterium]|nr:class A beta-lactamase-related serine hydrolase [Phycisphaerae bacterium]NNF43230.1 class A beta-lactamase-related serine hydrolase [Phycisphaerales bacterium]NNM25943.1 class A beta-lactamase-related serine hydrolase [Phycisphaerales bacterium]